MGELTAALIEEAMKKSGLVWLSLPGLPQPRAAWHFWLPGAVGGEAGGAAFVLTGGEGEQPLPGLPEAERVLVTVPSKDKRGLLVSWIAESSLVEPGSELWDTVAPMLAKDRLNAVGHEEQVARWADESYIIRLVPTGEAPEEPGTYSGDYATVRPVPTPATTAGPPPRMFGAKRRKVDR